MNTVDWIGFIGVFQILLAYLLNVAGKWGNHHVGFMLLNLIGAGMACLSSILIGYWPFILLEGVWTAVSLAALINLYRQSLSARMNTHQDLVSLRQSGETDLSILIKNMRPVLNDGRYVFVTISDRTVLGSASVIGEFVESEGLTVILSQQQADELGLSYDYIAAWITLQIHSSLAAVGLTAAFSAALAKQGISCNVVAGYYHDHLFVAEHDAPKAMDALLALA